MIPDKNNAFDYPTGEAIPVTVDGDAFRLTRTLMERIVEAQNIALKNEIEANAVVVNGRKYGMLKNRPGLTPTVFGMRLETRVDMPDDYDFIVQYREPEPLTNADRIRIMTDEELAKWLEFRDDNCPRTRCYKGTCHECWLDWLKAPAEEGKG
jgi:hypothetical protein